MLQLTQSPFLQALGYAIINSLWQFALLWFIYVSIYTFLKLSSHKKYAAGVVIQFAGFCWFVATFIFYFSQISPFQEIYFQQDKFSNSITPGTLTGVEDFFSGVTLAKTILPYLSVAYLFVLLFLCFKLIRTYFITKSIKTKGLQKSDVRLRLFVKQLSGQLGINREVKIYVSEMVKTPLTIGFFKPLILIPLATLNNLTADQIEAVILHELAHIKRFDYLFNLFLTSIEIVLFFNPFMHLISKHIKRERENCCDDWVLQYEYNATSYATALLRIAASQPQYILSMQAADNKKVLLNRIKRMIEKKENTFFNYRYQLVALFVMLTVLSALALISSRNTVNSAATSPSAEQVIGQPMIEAINRPFYSNEFSITPLERKVALDKRISVEKNSKKSTASNLSPIKSENNNTNKNIGKEQAFTKINPDVNETMAAVEDNQTAEAAEKNIELSNAALEEVNFPVIAGKQRELALAEDQIKELAKNLFENNKKLINQKELIAQIKAALDQLKAVKLQLINHDQLVNTVNLSTDVSRFDQLGIKKEFSPCDIEKFQLITKELQVQTEKAEKQKARESERSRRYYNSNLRPGIMSPIPFIEQPHSFSFEFSTDPRLKVSTENSFFKRKKEKEVNRKSQEEIKSFEFQNPSSFLEDLSPQPPQKKDNLIIVRI